MDRNNKQNIGQKRLPQYFRACHRRVVFRRKTQKLLTPFEWNSPNTSTMCRRCLGSETLQFSALR